MVILYAAYALLGSTIPWMPFVQGHADDASFPQGENPVFTGAHTGPDRALLIETPQDAYNVRIAMLRAARESVDIVYYAIEPGGSGDAFLGEVLHAANRGVRVRILLDGKINGGKIRKTLQMLQSHPGVECRLYNPAHLLKPWTWHAVLHNKIIITDGKHLLCGGRNIGDRFFAVQGFDKAITNDRDVFVTTGGGVDSVLSEVAAFIGKLWDHPASKVQKQRTDEDARMQGLLAAADVAQRENPGHYAKDMEDYLVAAHPTRKITLLTNPIHTARKTPTIGRALQGLAAGAKDSVIIQTPYATANKKLLAALSSIDDNAETIMLTNSVASSPNYFAFSNYFSTRKQFLKTGMDIYELQRRDSMHGKSMVVDDHLSIIGSLNLDDRSLYIDTENMLVIDSEPFAEQLRSAMEGYRDASLQVGMDNSYLPGKVEALEAPRYKVAGMYLISIISRLLQFLI